MIYSQNNHTHMKPDVNKFSIAQMTSNTSGKTSGSGTMGVLICVVGAFCFLLGCIDKMFIGKDIDVISQSIFFVGIGAGLLGYRKSKDGGKSEETETIEKTTETGDEEQQLNS